jgi:hypothetical protein
MAVASGMAFKRESINAIKMRPSLLKKLFEMSMGAVQAGQNLHWFPLMKTNIFCRAIN